MSEQRLLFEVREPKWTELLWRKIDDHTRRKVIEILAEMARARLPQKSRADAKGEEKPDES